MSLKVSFACRKKYGHDCLYAIFYAPIEVEHLGVKSSF